MISEGDRIGVGVSGGKDSLVLLKALANYAIFSPQKFSIVAITIDMFAGKSDFSEISKMCEELGVEYCKDFVKKCICLVFIANNYIFVYTFKSVNNFGISIAIYF